MESSSWLSEAQPGGRPRSLRFLDAAPTMWVAFDFVPHLSPYRQRQLLRAMAIGKPIERFFCSGGGAINDGWHGGCRRWAVSGSWQFRIVPVAHATKHDR